MFNEEFGKCTQRVHYGEKDTEVQKKAYLQVRADRTLWPYQTVVIKDRRCCLTQLGFRLNIALTIIKAVISCVLSLDPDIQKVRQRTSMVSSSTGTSPAQITSYNTWQSTDYHSVGHYPVCGWLGSATAFIKREANHGGTKARLWVDASVLALDVVLEVNGAIIEDAAWLRSDDGQHINMAQLDAVIKDLNLGLSWQMKDVELMTDSLTVHRWLNDSLSRRMRLKTKAPVEECSLNLTVTHKKCVSGVISNFDVCRSIDPAPVKWRHGNLRVERIWQRVSKVYLTPLDCGPSRFAVWRPLKYHTSVIDICEQLESIFCERAAPDELLADNDTAFRSQILTRLVERWNLRVRFRWACAPSGNGIIERCHRSVKVIATRKGCAVSEAVYWYKLIPRDDCSQATAPAEAIYAYPLRVRAVDSVVHEVQDKSIYSSRDEVWVKPAGSRCDSQFGRGIVTKVLSGQAVEVDGTLRHIKGIRRRTSLHQERQSEPETRRDESN
ncbi:LOW QUALITY PROTEIN: hypothetical protein M514_19379 [Trichuris suis]|uniref:Integrase catalytic domain-containing protein n=1 Tax=Trichuris suis TaxID=68888 RepID=A0A085NFT7_9BILA|nr:LOW QUALITY PROTEIN: hypothetical protein M514_19379 [Trichuris suis]